MDLFLHFHRLCSYRQIKTWYLVIQGRDMWERSDYILGTYRRRFNMVGIRGVIKYPSEHLFLRDQILIYPDNLGHPCDAEGPPA